MDVKFTFDSAPLGFFCSEMFSKKQMSPFELCSSVLAMFLAIISPTSYS